MPALNEAQRQKQIALAKKAKQSPKPKPGQKGQQTGNKGSSTKSETIGGAKPKPKPKATPADTGRYIPGNQQVPFQQPVLRKSPAIGAPVHARPSAFGSATQLQNGILSARPQPSAYAPQVGQAPRPNAPQPAQKIQENPYAGVGDVRGQQLNPSAAGLEQAPVQAGTQEYGGQKLQGIDENGIDMERRRAFLDADNSLAGLKAVKELLNRRKLSISVEN